MTADVIAAMHQELEYDLYAPDLKALTGIWAMLEGKRKKATTTAGVADYRSYLERCIAQLKTDKELEGEEFDAKLRVWIDFVKRRNTELDSKIHSREPIGVENWMAKWMEREYEDYRLAVNGWITRATQRSYDRLMLTTQVMFDAFEKAV